MVPTDDFIFHLPNIVNFNYHWGPYLVMCITGRTVVRKVLFCILHI